MQGEIAGKGEILHNISFYTPFVKEVPFKTLFLFYPLSPFLL